MKDIETQKQFIELRSKGISFDSISKTINISKPTLLKWSKMFEDDINDMERIQIQEMKENMLIAKKHRLEMLSNIIKEINTEIKEQPVLLSYDKLVKLSLKIFQQLDREEYYDFKKSLLLKNKTDSEEKQQSKEDIKVEDN